MKHHQHEPHFTNMNHTSIIRHHPTSPNPTQQHPTSPILTQHHPTSPNPILPLLPRYLQTQVFHQDLWKPLDLGQAAAYPLVNALQWSLQLAATDTWRLRRGGSCQAAVLSGSTSWVTVQLQLPAPEVGLDIAAPEGAAKRPVGSCGMGSCGWHFWVFEPCCKMPSSGAFYVFFLSEKLKDASRTKTFIVPQLSQRGDGDKFHSIKCFLQPDSRNLQFQMCPSQMFNDVQS